MHTAFLELTEYYCSLEYTFSTEKKEKIHILELWREKSTKAFFFTSDTSWILGMMQIPQLHELPVKHLDTWVQELN